MGLLNIPKFINKCRREPDDEWPLTSWRVGEEMSRGALDDDKKDDSQRLFNQTNGTG